MRNEEVIAKTFVVSEVEYSCVSWLGFFSFLQIYIYIHTVII